jgi:tRNA-dihydrouridine synthase A
MIDISNSHFRYFMRLITKRAQVYTEMLHHDAVIHNHAFLLPFSPEEHPIVLQLGGSDPQRLAEAALLGEQYGYDEINLNVGCPSPRVQKGSFGACLMKEPPLVRDCMEAMAEAVSIRCTDKCRLGVDDFDSYEFLVDFIKEVSCNSHGLIKHFVVHARKALLKGLNPAQNRTIPPLIYERVYRLRQDFPELSFEINGGIKSVRTGKQIVDDNDLQACMVGRMAYENPFELITVDEVFYGLPNYHSRYETDAIARREIMLQYADYIERL